MPINRATHKDDDELKKWRDFGLYLDDLRIKAGLEKKRLAEQSGISYTLIRVLLNGGRRGGGRHDPDEWVTPNPLDEQLGKLAKTLHVPVERMFEKVGRYADRPRTQTAKRGPGRYGGNATVSDDLRDQFDEMERRLERMERQLLGEKPPEEPTQTRRRRGTG